MSGIKLFLLGSTRIKKSTGLITSPGDSQILQLLIYLSTTRTRHSYSDLKSIFGNHTSRIWGELRRQSDGLVGLPFEDYILRDVDNRGQTVSMQIRSYDDVHCDIFEFHDLLHDLIQGSGDYWNADSLALLEQAMNMYAGEFAQGVRSNYEKYNVWLRRERNKYRHLGAWAMLQLMFVCWSNASLVQARSYGEMWLQKDNHCHQWTGWVTYFLMCISYWHDQPERALTIYQDYQNNLGKQQAEMPYDKDLAHWEQIDTLVDRIQQGTVPAPPQTVDEWQALQRALRIEIPPSLALDKPDPPITQLETRETPLPVTDPNQRNRNAILQQIRSYWIEAYLDSSLADVPHLDLQVKPEYGLVAGLQDKILQSSNRRARSESYLQINQFFETYQRKLLIVGDAGSGKTTALLQLCRYLLEQAEFNPAYPMPVIFPLSSWQKDHAKFEDWLIEELNSKYHVPIMLAEQMVEIDAMTLLLDGLDEVELDLQIHCIDAINEFRARHGLVNIAISSRVQEYHLLKDEKKLMLNGALLVKSLTDVQVERYLEEARFLTDGMMAFIDKNPMMRDFFRSPLVLNLMVRAFLDEDTPDLDDVFIPDGAHHLFHYYIERMYQRRIGDKSYTLEQTLDYLTWLAHKMQSHSQQVFHIELLQPSWLSKNKQNIYHNAMWLGSAFLMAIFSGFLASSIGALITSRVPETRLPETMLMYISMMWVFFSKRELWRFQLAHLIPGLCGAIGILIHLAMFPGSVDNLMFNLLSAFFRYSAFSYIASIVFKSVSSRMDRIVPSERMVFSFENTNLRATFAGFIAGAVINLLYLPPGGHPVAMITGMIVTGMITALCVYLLTGFTIRDVPMRVEPNQGIRASSSNAFFISLFSFIFLIALLVGLLVRTDANYAIWRGTVFGLFFVYPLWFFYGGIAVQQHYLLRWMLQLEKRTPADIQDFLDFAVSLILMRRVGGGYTFIHASLQEYLANLYSETGE